MHQTHRAVHIRIRSSTQTNEIRVLDDLVKQNNRLNVNVASYSARPQSRHVLLVFATDSSICEMLLESSSWPHSICALTFKVTLLSPITTSHFVHMNRVPYESHVECMRTLIDQCFRCQQFGHSAICCSNESKCYKCGENHEYNRYECR